MEQRLLFETAEEISAEVSASLKVLRKRRKITQQNLSFLTGIPLPTLRRFEQKGEISFVSLIRIAQALHCEDQVKVLFRNQKFESVEEVLLDGKINR